jgi:uncharacterized protein (TIGR02145 family)
MAIVMAAALLLPILNTCKKSDDTPNPPVPDVIIPESTRVIEAATWDNYFLSADSADWSLTMDPGITLVEGIAVGDVIVVNKGQGLLRRVTAIQPDNGTVVLTTEFASVCDAIQKGSFSFEQNLSAMMKEARIEYLMPGVKMLPLLKDGQESQITFSIEVPVHDHITVTGELEIDPSISGEAIIEDFTLEYLRMAFVLEEVFELSTKVDIATLTFEKELEIARVTFPTITVWVGTVPVLITPEFVLKLGVNVEVSSELTVGVIQELTVTAGVEYENGSWSPLMGLDKSFGHSGPELSNTLEAKAYIKPEISMLIYHVLSPTLSAELYGLLEAELLATPWWTLYAGLSADIGVKLKVWKFTLIDYNVNLFDHKIPIASADDPGNTKPTAAFSVTPTSGSVDTLFSFDASASYDNEDPSDALEVRWDWEDDGIWDTDYTTVKTASHQFQAPGSKAIRLSVRDSGGLSDEDVKTVSVTWGSSGGGIPCPGLEEFEYGGRIYHTTLIGDQCWMKENLDVGIMINGNEEPSDNGIIEKFCYDNDPANCEIFGGLYYWDELMDYSDEPGSRGICPPGWHVATDEEWMILEGNADSYYGVGSPTWTFELGRGTDVATRLKSTFGWDDNGNGTDDLGFTALPGGVKYTDNYFASMGAVGWWTTSSTDTLFDGVWSRVFYDDKPTSWRFSGNKLNGHATRCLKD